jgi:hypothetical protein
MFTFAIVSSNAWARQCKTSGVTASAGKASCAKHAGFDRNYTAMHTHVQWSVHLSALLIT